MGLWVARHPLPVLIGWVVVIIAMVLLVARIGALTNNDLTLPGTDSQEATDLLAEQVPAPAERREPDRLPRRPRQGRPTTRTRRRSRTPSRRSKAPRTSYSATDPFGAGQRGADLEGRDRPRSSRCCSTSAPRDLDDGAGAGVLDAAEPRPRRRACRSRPAGRSAPSSPSPTPRAASRRHRRRDDHPDLRVRHRSSRWGMPDHHRGRRAARRARADRPARPRGRQSPTSPRRWPR